MSAAAAAGAYLRAGVPSLAVILFAGARRAFFFGDAVTAMAAPVTSCFTVACPLLRFLLSPAAGFPSSESSLGTRLRLADADSQSSPSAARREFAVARRNGCLRVAAMILLVSRATREVRIEGAGDRVWLESCCADVLRSDASMTSRSRPINVFFD